MHTLGKPAIEDSYDLCTAQIVKTERKILCFFKGKRDLRLPCKRVWINHQIRYRGIVKPHTADSSNLATQTNDHVLLSVVGSISGDHYRIHINTRCRSVKCHRYFPALITVEREV